MLLEKLKEQGWYLTEDGLKKLTTNNNLHSEDVNKIITLALDSDYKDIGAGALPSKPDSNGIISGRIVLQIQKMRNISAPKANEESTVAPRFLQLELSDGVNTIVALEFERISSLNLNVPPGTKLFMKAEKLKLLNGFLVLKPSEVEILGGRVEVLVEKWEVARQMLKYARSSRRLSGSSGPPPWTAFGKRLDVHKEALPTDKNFKSLQAANEKDKNSKENDEFIASRSQAIAEAAKAGQKKVFGGGHQNILDHNFKKIIEKGYPEDKAKEALEKTNNNLERALYNLKKRRYKSASDENNKKPETSATGSRLKDRSGIATSKEDAVSGKPQKNVSLFDFLTDKLPVTPTASNTLQSQTLVSNNNNGRSSKEISSKTNNTKAVAPGGNRFENNMSSSFAANRATNTSRYDEKFSTQSRSNSFNQRHEERKQQSSSKNVRNVDRNNTQNRAQPQTINFDRQQKQTSTIKDDNVSNMGGNGNAKINEKLSKKERESTPKQFNSEFQDNKHNSELSEKKTYQSRENNRNQDLRNNNSNQQKQNQKYNNFEKGLDSLVDITSKMSIQNRKHSPVSRRQFNSTKRQQSSNDNPSRISASTQRQQQKNSSENYANNSQQQTPQFKNPSNFSFKQNAKQATVNSQQRNECSYDPSKIMGFQSKEANEYAMNLLKSQGLMMQQLQQQAVPPQLQQTISLQQALPQTQIINNQNPTAVAYMPQSPNLFVTPPQQAPQQFGVISGSNWPWKEGDLCLAKYWDDGNYYDAKITAIADKTCVVLFLGYGNHEEVLKSDCLPLTDAQHIPLNAYQNNISLPSISQPAQPAFQQRSGIAGIGSGGSGSQRYRGERQMYIPPPKRNNN